MRTQFSHETRKWNLQKMAEESVDLLVIGGGITGAGIAWDAALRGLRVALVEQNDFASGTSSRSTKLIHGGLRYLAQGEINLVREVGQERAILHRLAGHVVHPTLLLLPIYQGGQYGWWGTMVGLWLYDRLAKVKKSERRLMLDKTATLQREGRLLQDGLRGGGLYVEYRTDDARLTMEVIKSAHEAGALIAHYAKVTDLAYDASGNVCGAQVQDLLGEGTLTVKAAVVVNAAGPWVDVVRKYEGELSGKRLHLTKGVHLTISRERLPLTHAVYIGTDDGRMVFVIPRGTKTYIGTTDTNYEGPIHKPVCTREDAVYLLRAVNHHFPGMELVLSDVESAWAGLRPLLHEDGKSPSELSRKEEIFKSDSGLYSMAGGKLTGFRKMAEKMVDRVVADLQSREPGRSFRGIATGVTTISGGHLGAEGFEAFQTEMVKQGARYGLEREMVEMLVQRYGSNVCQIFGYLDQDLAQKVRVGGPLPVIRAEVTYAVEQEMTVTLTDFLLRRTGDLLFAAEQALAGAPRLLEEFAMQLGWDHAERERQMQLWDDAVQQARGFLAE